MRSLLPALPLLLLAPSPPPPTAGEAVAVESAPVLLDPADASRTEVGSLAWRGGLALRSPEPRFGGWSDLVVSRDGKDVAVVSDEGHFLTGHLRYDGKGFLGGVADAVFYELHDTQGRALVGKAHQDAESLVQMDDGSFLVGFERWHRLWRYPSGPGGPAETVDPPRGLDKSPENGGVETLVRLSRDRLLALTEEKQKNGILEGWLRQGSRWETIGYRLDGALRPSGGCRLPSGDLLVLERSYTKETGVTARLRRIPEGSVRPGSILEGTPVATLARPLTVDNFEGVSCREGGNGETLVYLVSDDNYSPSQRTLLLMFALKGGS